MENPWLKLSTESPYLLDIDKRSIDVFAPNHADQKLQLASVPEPFIGNPETARVVLLLLNPGHDEADPRAHSDPQLKQALFRNLSCVNQPYPFYPLNPMFSWSPTAKWWVPRLRKLIQQTQLSKETVSERLIALEWFPYHSKSSGLPPRRICESQEYTFSLLREMIGNRYILRMRSEKHWSMVDQRLKNLPSLSNPRCTHISEDNTEPGVFNEIVKELS